MMGSSSLLSNWPSYDPHNFSQLRPSDPSHPSSVIRTESTNILLRQLYRQAEDKLRPKRAASDHLIPDHSFKHPRGCYD
ncbi:hypothetical protein QJS04_geneDACA013178 [Acorus gramineus]|uniref:DET1- and DDB1-associated protein 1 domain-containing protein n=1 Tax=Acorus gramineus TaxID=55184 RepID=A0AAV9B9E2_ACOGR|nr:hypothetical protein QJS04_geneDACA013178 [Acorus gramineus]